MIRNHHPLAWWFTLFSVCVILTIGIPIGFTYTYVAAQFRHECTALNLLTVHPPIPSPGQKPSAIETQRKFYEALSEWDKADGCR